MSNHWEDTVELSPEVNFADTFFVDSPFVGDMEFGAATHQGKVRSNNEDQFAVIKLTRSKEMLLSSLSPGEYHFPAESTYTLVVADGIGGARSGEVASRVTLQTMLELSGQVTSWLMRVTDLEAQQMRQRVDAYLQRIQKTLQDLSRNDPNLSGMGTTWTSAHIFPSQAVIVHLGDSRAYLFHDGRLDQITRDETMAQAMIDSGMTPESTKRYRHLLINSLGGTHDTVSAQIHKIDLTPGDQLLLCTDGLTDMVTDEEICDQLRKHPSPQLACDALTSSALEAGGKDNVTVVLASAR